MNTGALDFSRVKGKISELYRKYDSHDFTLRGDNFSYRRAIGYLAFFALLLRLIIAASYLNSFDTEWNIMWGVQLSEGFFNAHTHVSQLDYPPLYLYPLFVVGKLINNPTIGGYPPFRMLAIKFIPCLCDSLTCAVLYAIARRRDRRIGMLAAVMWAVNPAAILNCACWGQTDCVLMFLVALLMLSLQEKRVTAAGILWAVMCSTKLQGLYLTPVVRMEVLTICFGSLHPKQFSLSKALKDDDAVIRFIKFICASLGTLVLVYLPFMIGCGFSEYQPGVFFTEKFFKPIMVYTEGVDKYPYCTLNGDNIYMLFGLNGIKDELQVMTGLSVATIGKIFLLLAVAGVVAVYIFGRRRSHWLAGFMFMECIFMLTCRQHERYQIVALVLLIGAFIQLADRRLLTLFGLQSLVIFFNQFRILSSSRESAGWWKYYKHAEGSAEWLANKSNFAFVNSLFNLMLFIAAAVFAARYFCRETARAEGTTEL